MNAEIEKLIAENKKKWARLDALKKALIKEHGELIGLILYRQKLEEI